MAAAMETKTFSIIVREHLGECEFELCKVRSHPWAIVQALEDKYRYEIIRVVDSATGRESHNPDAC